jgi:hypothetical protein
MKAVSVGGRTLPIRPTLDDPRPRAAIEFGGAMVSLIAILERSAS